MFAMSEEMGPSSSQATAEYLQRVGPHLRAAGFNLTRGVAGGYTLDLIAIRKRPVEAPGLDAEYFLFSTLPSIDEPGLKAFREACHRHMDSQEPIRKPVGVLTGYFPVALTFAVELGAGWEVRLSGHYGGRFQMPAIVDLGTGDLHHLTTPSVNWDDAYFPLMLETVNAILGA
jgi:hypothetical protein